MSVGRTNLWADDYIVSKKCVITAGKTKQGRQQYIASYGDCEDWNISVVPTITTKTRAYEVLSKVKRELPILMEKRKWAHIQKDIQLEIVEVDDSFVGAKV